LRKELVGEKGYPVRLGWHSFIITLLLHCEMKGHLLKEADPNQQAKEKNCQCKHHESCDFLHILNVDAKVHFCHCGE